MLSVAIVVAFAGASWAQGWGSPLGGDDAGISPREPSGYLPTPTTAAPTTAVPPAPEDTSSSSGWGMPDISPSQGMMDNPWFRASDFLPNPDEYKAPKKEEVEAIRDNVVGPTVVWVETVMKDGTSHRANFKSLLVDDVLYVPVIVLPKMFTTKVRWKAAEQRLYVYRGSESLEFTLHHGLRVDFFG